VGALVVVASAVVGVVLAAVALAAAVAVLVVVALQEDGNEIYIAIHQTYFYLKSINATVL
jgi:hypothetical protein